MELEPPGAGALVSARCAFVARPMETASIPDIPRPLFDMDPCPFRALPSMFSIKNDDALDEVGVGLSVSFSCMFSQFHGASRQNRAVPVSIARYCNIKSKRSFQASQLFVLVR